MKIPRRGGRDLEVEIQLALKMSAAGTLSWWLGTLAGEPRPIFAALVPLVSMSADPFSAVNVSVARVVGVFAGVVMGLGVIALPVPTLAKVAIGLLAATVAGITLRVGGRPNVQAAVSVLFMLGLQRIGATHAGAARIWETAIGAGVTILVSVLLWPAHPVRELRIRVGRLSKELSEDLAAVADDLSTGSGATRERLDVLRARSLDAVRDVFELDRARAALRWNLLRRSHTEDFDDLEQRVHLGARLYRHARSIARDVSDAGELVRGSEVGEQLAAATADIALAADRLLQGMFDVDPMRRARERLERMAVSGDALVIRAQLGQMLSDLRTRSY